MYRAKDLTPIYKTQKNITGNFFFFFKKRKTKKKVDKSPARTTCTGLICI